MSEKNWLIRTSQKKILGPVSKQKVIEFIDKGTLSNEDEVSCGNGYWFWIKEEALVNKYLYGDVPQTFNPVSEAVNVLTANNQNPNLTASISRVPTQPKERKKRPTEPQTPKSEDLEYPDLSLKSIEDELPIESSSSIGNKKVLPESKEVVRAEGRGTALYPEGEDLEYPDLEGTQEINTEDLTGDIDLSEVLKEEVVKEESPVQDLALDKSSTRKKTSKRNSRKKKRSKKSVPVSTRNDRYLFGLLFLLVIIVFGVFYYYKFVLNRPFPYVGFINSVQAQEVSALGKKKTLSTLNLAILKALS